MAHDAKVEAASKTAALLAGVWQRNLPVVQERIELLRQTAALRVSGLLPQQVREDAASAAHKLAGSLGMFGFHEGTRIARELEEMLGLGQEPDAETLILLVEDLSRSLNARD